MQAHKTPHSLNNYPVAKQHQQIEFSVALNFYNEKLLIRKNNMFCFSGLFMTYMHSLLYTLNIKLKTATNAVFHK